MEVIKSSGEKEQYDPKKVRRSIKRTGAKDKLVESVMDRVEDKLYDGISTKELYRLVERELKKEDVCFACRYNLREGILALGPAGFKFEKYVVSILNAYGWSARNPEEELEGACVMHEVDVIAEKDNRNIFIEAKFRNEFSGKVDLKDTMATWSRFLDLVDASAVGKTMHFDEPWIVTNAKFSDRARSFGVCKGIHMIGWSFPKERSFGQMVDNMALYPITVLDELKKSELHSFFEQGIMLCKEVTELDSTEIAGRTGMSEERARELVELCTIVIEGSGKDKQ